MPNEFRCRTSKDSNKFLLFCLTLVPTPTLDVCRIQHHACHKQQKNLNVKVGLCVSLRSPLVLGVTLTWHVKVLSNTLCFFPFLFFFRVTKILSQNKTTNKKVWNNKTNYILISRPISASLTSTLTSSCSFRPVCQIIIKKPHEPVNFGHVRINQSSQNFIKLNWTNKVDWISTRALKKI